MMETLQTLVQTIVCNQLNQMTSDRGSMSLEAKYLRDFKKYDPNSFDGSFTDPTEAEIWFSSMETIFWYMKCPEDHKVQCASFMLRGEAFLWWESAERTIDVIEGLITWLRFKEDFFQNYYPTVTKFRKQSEFLKLKQGNQTIHEYEREFMRWSCFSIDLVDT